MWSHLEDMETPLKIPLCQAQRPLQFQPNYLSSSAPVLFVPTMQTSSLFLSQSSLPHLRLHLQFAWPGCSPSNTHMFRLALLEPAPISSYGAKFSAILITSS
jgi:hypothetical protein